MDSTWRVNPSISEELTDAVHTVCLIIQKLGKL
jgi:hypothetical protein